MGGFGVGFGAGVAHANLDRARKNALTDEEHEQKLGDYNATIQTTLAKMSAMGPNHPDYRALQSVLDNAVSGRTQLFHPDQPGGLERLGKMLWNRVHGEQPAQPQAAPTAPQVQQTHVPGVPASTGPAMVPGGAPLQTPELPGYTQASVAPYQFKNQIAAQMAGAASTGAPTNPLTDHYNQLIAANFSPADAHRAIAISQGLEAKPIETRTPISNKLFDLPDGSQRWLDVNDPSSIPQGARPVQAGAVPKVGSFGDFMMAAYGAHPTAAQYGEGRQAWAKSNAGTTVGTHTIEVPQPDGSIKLFRVETTSTKQFPGAGEMPGERQDAGGNVVSPTFNGKMAPGMTAPGNIDLSNRPNIDNGDGTHSSVFSMSFNVDGKEVLVPGVGDGKTYPLRKLSRAEALDQYKKTGKNLGTFDSPQASDRYAQTLHEDQARGNKPATPGELKHHAAAALGGGVSGGVTVGGRLTAPQVAAQKEVDDAAKLVSLADDAAAHPSATADKVLVGALQKTIEGRFNQGAYDNLSKKYGLVNTFEGWLKAAESGQLPDEVRHELVNEAHSVMGAAKASRAESMKKPGDDESGDDDFLMKVK